VTLAFVVNSGSSSIKYQLIDMATEETVQSGFVERLGEAGSAAGDHAEGMSLLLESLDSTLDIRVVGHRVVHGGLRFDRATVVTKSVIQQIEDLSTLAPLHNPANLTGIRAAMQALPDIPHVAVFDTAFHQNMPAEAYMYAIDTEIAELHAIRKYGFHGTSVAYVTTEATRSLGTAPEHTNLIVLHLGNGASITAIRNGRSFDTSMGLTPLQGLVMGTRAGDIDAAVVSHLTRVAGMDIKEVDELLNYRSGMLGLTGFTDMRDVLAAVARGDQRAINGIAVWRHRIRSYIGAYVAHLGRVDALVFTAGIGENSAALRELACEGLEHLGFILDSPRNEQRVAGVRDIATNESASRILIVPTNEELEIARQAVAAIS
jgi:acetate kinase